MNSSSGVWSGNWLLRFMSLLGALLFLDGWPYGRAERITIPQATAHAQYMIDNGAEFVLTDSTFTCWWEPFSEHLQKRVFYFVYVDFEEELDETLMPGDLPIPPE